MENNLTNKEMVMALERLPEGCVIVNPAPNEFVAYEYNTVLDRDTLLNSLKQYPDDNIIMNTDCGVLSSEPAKVVPCECQNSQIAVVPEKHHECKCECNHNKEVFDSIMEESNSFEMKMAEEFKRGVMSKVEDILDDFIAYNHNTNVNNLVNMIEYVDKK